MDNSRALLTDFTDETRNVKPSHYFMMRSLLHSRVDGGEHPAPESGEESVDAYFAHLLQSFNDPEHAESARSHLHRYDQEALGRLSRSTNARLKYTIYRTDTDCLFVSVGIFDNPGQALMQKVHAGPAARRIQEPTEEVAISRGPAYYRFSYQYSQLVPRRRPALSEVMDKLSRGLDRYTRILAHLRGEYVDIVEQLGRGEIYHLERTVNAEERREKILERQDKFLDAYAGWRQTGGDSARARLDRAIEALQTLDPEFRFDVDAHPSNERGRTRGTPEEGHRGGLIGSLSSRLRRGQRGHASSHATSTLAPSRGEAPCDKAGVAATRRRPLSTVL